MKRFGGFDKWVSYFKETKEQYFLHVFKEIKIAYENRSIPFFIVDKSKISKRLEEDIVSLAKNQPHTKFHIIIPPYSKLYWKLDRSFFGDFKFAITYLVKASSKTENLLVHGFDSESFTRDISNYKDKDHFCPKINSFMLDAIRGKMHVLTLKNVDAYLKQFEEDIKHYDLKPFYDQIKDLNLDN